MTSAKPVKVKVRRLSHAIGLPLPAYQTADAAGLDLLAALADDSPLTLAPGARAVVPTGLTLELPRGSEAQVRPRSGLAAKHGVTVLNSPGTIDADYRGEVAVILINHGSQSFTIRRGERIAQMVIATVVQAKLIEASALSQTRRGAGGFGSTGTAQQKPVAQSKKSKAVAQTAKNAKPATPKRAPRKSR